MAETAYIVLRRTRAAKSLVDAAPTTGGNGSEQWEVAATVQASSSDSAIRKHASNAKTSDDQSGTYVAVPARSWKPVTVQAVQTTTIKLGEAT